MLRWAMVPLLLFCTSVQAQPCNLQLHGRVTDHESGAPLERAGVHILGPHLFATTRDDGGFSFENLCPGLVRLEISHIGCSPVVVEFHLRGDTTLNLVLKHYHDLLEGVTVVEKRQEGPLTTQALQLSGNQLNTGPALTLGEQLRLLPGMDALETGTSISKPMIQGLTGNRVLILQNGIRLEGQQWGQEHAPEIDPFLADQISAFRGSQGLEFGPGAVGGVILVQPAAPDFVTPLQGKVQVRGQSNGWGGGASAMLQGLPIHGLPLFARGHITLNGYGTRMAPNYLLSNTGNRELHWSGTLAWERPRYGLELFYSQYNTTIGILSVAHVGNLTDLDRIIQGGPLPDTAQFTYAIRNPRQDVFHETFKFSGRVFLTERLEGEFQVARQFNDRQEYDKHRTLGADPAKPQLDYSLTTWTGDVHLHFRHGKGKTKFGLQGVSMANTYAGRYLIPNYTLEGFGAFANHAQPLGKTLVEAIVRYDLRATEAWFNRGGSIFSKQRTLQGLSASAGFKGPLWKGTWHAQLGTAWRPPFVNEWYSDGLHHGSGSIERGDSTLVPEQSIDLQLGWDGTMGKHTLNVWGSVRRVDQFMYLEPRAPELTLAGAFPVFAWTQSDALFLGLDVRLTSPVGKGLSWTNQASVLYHQNLETGGYLPLMPPPSLRSDLTVAEGRWFAAQPELTVGCVMYLHQAWAPVGEDPLAPPPGYALLNLSFTKTWNKNHTLQLGAQNLLNTPYRSYLDRWRYYADQPGINVYLRYTLQFKTTQTS